MVNNSIWFTRSDSSLEYKNDKKQNFSDFLLYCYMYCITSSSIEQKKISFQLLAYFLSKY